MRSFTLEFGALIFLIALAQGCASYEYDISETGGAPQHVGSKAELLLNRDPLEYRWITVESRLVVRIYNETEASITLAGDRSSAVDPGGQSHPLPTQTMAPHSFIKLIVPPLRPHIEREGPSIGIGIGVVAGDFRRRGDRWDWYDNHPQYLTIYDNDAIYWSWTGESTVRLNLVFQRQQSGESFEHAFIIARKKM